MNGLTQRQYEIVQYISEFIHQHGYSPSYREICLKFGFSSVGTVYKHIQVLKRKGLLSSDDKCKRSLSLKEKSENPGATEMALPFIGRIAAGAPIEIFSQSQSLAVPKHLVSRPDKTYILQAKGDALNEEMIVEGDLLLVEARQEANPGDTVVALINQQDTIIKKYYPEGDFVYLTGHNPNHKPIILRHEDIRIQGIVIGLIRNFS